MLDVAGPLGNYELVEITDRDGFLLLKRFKKLLSPSHRLIISGRGRYYGVLDQGELVAVSLVRIIRTHCIRNIVVSPEHRRKGILKLVNERMEQAASDAGLISVYRINKRNAPMMEYFRGREFTVSGDMVVILSHNNE